MDEKDHQSSEAGKAPKANQDSGLSSDPKVDQNTIPADPALGTIASAKIKVPVDPGEKMVKAKECPRKGNPYKLAIIILSLVILGMAAAIIFLLFCPISPLVECPKNNNDDSSVEDSDDNSPTIADCSQCEILEREDNIVREMITQIIPTVDELIKPFSMQGVTYYNVYADEASDITYGQSHSMTVYYRPDGCATAVPLNRSYGIILDTPAVDSQPDLWNLVYKDFYAAVADQLKDLGFTDTGKSYTTASTGPGITAFVNHDAGVVCGLVAAELGCGYATWYDQAQAEFSNELAKAYQKATGEEAELLIARVDNVKDSSVEPYQTTVAVMTSSKASFYRVSPDAEW